MGIFSGFTGLKSRLNYLTKKIGQFIVTEDTKELYADIGANKRIKIGYSTDEIDFMLSNKVDADSLPKCNVVFSDTRPDGNWTLWLQDLGEITEPTKDEAILSLETAPLDHGGDFIAVGEDGYGETILNMTDDVSSASYDDIVVVDN